MQNTLTDEEQKHLRNRLDYWLGSGCPICFSIIEKLIQMGVLPTKYKEDV